MPLADGSLSPSLAGDSAMLSDEDDLHDLLLENGRLAAAHGELVASLAPRAGLFSRLRRGGTALALLAWFVVTAVVCGALLGRHVLAPLHPVKNEAALRAAMVRLREPSGAGRLHAVHILYADCRCSERIAEHLLASARPTNVIEDVLLVGTSELLGSRIRAAGFQLTEITPHRLLNELGVTTAPLLVVTDGAGDVRYAGGYTSRKQGPNLHDLDILAAVAAGRSTETLPVYGCGVADERTGDAEPGTTP